MTLTQAISWLRPPEKPDLLDGKPYGDRGTKIPIACCCLNQDEWFVTLHPDTAKPVYFYGHWGLGGGDFAMHLLVTLPERVVKSNKWSTFMWRIADPRHMLIWDWYETVTGDSIPRNSIARAR